MCFIVHKVDSSPDPSVLPLAVFLPPGDHHHAQQHPADAETQVPSQIHGVEDQEGSAYVNEKLHQDPVDSGGVEPLCAAVDGQVLPEPRSIRGAAWQHRFGRCHSVGLPLGPSS